MPVGDRRSKKVRPRGAVAASGAGRVRHALWRGGGSSARVSRSRAMPVGDRRSKGAASGRGGGIRCGEGAARTLAWRRVIGAGFALPRDAGRRPALQRCGLGARWRHPVRGGCGTHFGVAEGHRRGFRAPARCRSETGAPKVRPRGAVAASGAGRVRHALWRGAVSSALVSRSRAIPVGDRRSKGAASGRGGGIRCGEGAARTLAWRSVMRAGFALPRDAGRRPALQRCGLGERWRHPVRGGCGTHTLAWRSVMRAGFALPRDAGRRPALHVPAILRRSVVHVSPAGGGRCRSEARRSPPFTTPRRCRGPVPRPERARRPRRQRPGRRYPRS